MCYLFFYPYLPSIRFFVMFRYSIVCIVKKKILKMFFEPLTTGDVRWQAVK
jgi:hypothetical protein